MRLPETEADHPVADERDADDTSVDTRLIWAGFFLALAVFSKVPGLDLLASAHYYSAEAGFFRREEPMVRFLYDWTPPVGRGLVLLLLLYALMAPLVSRWFAARGDAERARRAAGPWRRTAVLAFCCALLGPGIAIEGVLKNTMGRPRPVQVEAFGGDQAYLGPFVPGPDASRYRSFVSSHAAAGFALMSLGLASGPVWRRRWLLIGVVTGSVIGLGRMMQGGHFLSDVVFAFYIVWLSCELVAWVDRRLQHRQRGLPAGVSGRYPPPRS